MQISADLKKKKTTNKRIKRADNIGIFKECKTPNEKYDS